MPARPSIHSRLSPDPYPGTPAWNVTAQHLDVFRDRLRRLEVLSSRLPEELTDVRCRIRDAELRLGLPPSFPAPGPTD